MHEGDFEKRRRHLQGLSDAELNQRFWQLTGQLVDPLLALARENTTPSIERSVLLRMGFSSLEAKAIVGVVMEQGLMGKGAGHLVLRLARARGIGLREAGTLLIQGVEPDRLRALFDSGVKHDT